MTLSATPSDSTPIGYFRIFAQPPGGVRREITLLRGAPVILNTATTQDPFTEGTAQITLPQVTLFDSPGDGDLDWLVEDCDIDIVWENTGPYEFDWRWEGFIASMDFSMSGSDSTFSISLKGAFFGLDDYQAQPSFPKQPIPYEYLIRRAFDQSRYPARLAPLKITFPPGWSLRVPQDKDPDYLSFLKPWGVSTGQLWTGLTSRSTGSWEPVLTGFVQSLLAVMFAEGGAQWTIRNNGHRRPELFLRTRPDLSDPSIVEVTLGAPGVALQASKDYTQRANVIYGSGQDEAGITFNGMQVSPDGDTTYFKPFAYDPKAYPRTGNPSYNSNKKPKEVLLQFQTGVNEADAAKIAQAQWHRFNDPGVTGTLTLTTDARMADGTPVPRLLIRAGQTIRINGLFGIPDGLLVHVTTASVDFENLVTTLTFDSKYRDELTVAEVQARTRDALVPLRALQVGKYSNTVQDLVIPWSYLDGSGCVPLGSKEFFTEKLPSTAQFPYEDFTTQYPPSNPAYAPYYIKLNPADLTNSKNNWAAVARDGVQLMSIPFRMSQAGTIKLSQFAVYDKSGHVLPVRFHVSVFKTNGVAADAMPVFPYDPETGDPGASLPPINYLKPRDLTNPGHFLNSNYGAFQPHPLYEGAWESVKPDGTLYSSDAYLTAQNAGLIVGWGNYYEPAGYWPGRFSRGADATGMMVDSTQWSWEFGEDEIDLRDPANNANIEYAGMLFLQFYTDENVESAYVMGRFFRVEPGTS